MKKLTGMKFGRLTVVEFAHTDKWHRSHWVCSCSCGNSTVVSSSSLIQGDTKSCGCYNRSSEPHEIHGYSNHPLYTMFYDMRTRCYTEKSRSYKNYGGRGITICDKWLEDPILFIKWALKNGWRRDLQIDRTDNDKGYSPDNCRFVTCRVNIHNQRSSDSVGVKKDKRCQSYSATIWSKGRYVFSKNCKTFNEAAKARNNFIVENNLPHKLTKLQEEE